MPPSLACQWLSWVGLPANWLIANLPAAPLSKPASLSRLTLAPPSLPVAADKAKPSPPGLLRELITNSFTFQSDSALRDELVASMRAVAGGGTEAASRASSITFKTGCPTAAAAASLQLCTSGH